MQPTNHGQGHTKKHHGFELRQCDVKKLLPAFCTIHAGCFVQISGNTLHGSHIQDDIEAKVARYLGFNVILYVAAMQSIPRDLYEAASMDGAKSWQKFFYITLPQLKPMMFFGVTLTVIGGLQLFEEPFIFCLLYTSDAADE